MYALCEQLLVKAANKESFTTEFEKITNFYADDFKPNALETQLKTLPFILPLGASKAETFRDVLKQVKGLSKGQKLLIGEVVKLLKLVIVMPATNAVSERSFSAMRRLYTYLRTNMSQNRLNTSQTNSFLAPNTHWSSLGNLGISICKERTSQLNLLVFILAFKNKFC